MIWHIYRCHVRGPTMQQNITLVIRINDNKSLLICETTAGTRTALCGFPYNKDVRLSNDANAWEVFDTNVMQNDVQLLSFMPQWEYWPGCLVVICQQLAKY